MLYHYLAATAEGKILEADLDADDLSQVLQFLAGKELRPVSVKPVKQAQGSAWNIFASGINTGDKVFLTKYLSLMLKVGTDLLAAIGILIEDFDKPAMKNLLLEVRENLTKGRPFHEAFAAHPREFSGVFVNLVRAAEASGNLQQTFEDMSKSLERDAELQSRTRSALIYPVILLCVSILVFLFLVTFALPKIAKVFLESGVQPPTFSRIVFAIGLFVNDYIWVIGLVLLVTVIPSLYFFLKNPVGRKMASRIASRLPLVHKLYRDMAVQRFASTFSSLLKAGLPIMQATQITADVVGAEEFRLSLIRIADEGLAKGLTIGDAFRREAVFPRVVTNLVAISEKAGHLQEVLETLAEFYAANVDSNVRALVAVLEPLLLIFMGLLVGSIAVAIIVPIYQLSSQF